MDFMTANDVRRLMAENGMKDLAMFESHLDDKIRKTEKSILDQATSSSRDREARGTDIYLDMIPGGEMKEEMFPPPVRAYVEHFRSRGFDVAPVMGSGRWFTFDIRW